MMVVILGAGGLAREVLAALHAAGETVAGFLVEPGFPAGMLHGLPVTASLDGAGADARLVIAIGDGRIRARLAHGLAGSSWATVRHTAAILGPNVTLGEGAMLLGPCSATTDVTIGAHVLINPGCTLAHDCRIGDFASLGPAVALAGGVAIGEGASLGTGAVVAPGVRIGAWAVVGAGAVVIADVEPGDTVAGVPARSLGASRS